MAINYQMLGAKKRLIERLRNKGISDENVLNAFDKVDRHLFVESFLWNKAYDDVALVLMNGQTISHPYTVAFQSQLLKLEKGDKVLEIGTGSGFQAAILDAMGAKVYTIERQQVLYNNTSKLLGRLAPNVVTRYGDGFKGIPAYAPYNKVIVTCGAPIVPDVLMKQLKVGGVMVIPVGEGAQVMKRLTKIDDDNYEEETFGDFLFVPMLKEKVSIKK